MMGALLLLGLIVHAQVDEPSPLLSRRRYELLRSSLRNLYLSKEEDENDSQNNFQNATTMSSSGTSTTSSAMTGENTRGTTAKARNDSLWKRDQVAAYIAYLYASAHQRGEEDDDEEEESHDDDPQHQPHRQQHSPHNNGDVESGRLKRTRRAASRKDDRTASLHGAFPIFPSSKRKKNIDLIKRMFWHGWDSYLQHGFPKGEVKPVSCMGAEFDLVKLPALTLIDGLDMLLLMGNYTEFARSVERVRYLYSPSGFAVNQNVSVFETNIRVLGGLLSAHQLALAYLLPPEDPHDGGDNRGGANGDRRPRVLQSDVFDSDNNIRTDYDHHEHRTGSTPASTAPSSMDPLRRGPLAHAAGSDDSSTSSGACLKRAGGEATRTLSAPPPSTSRRASFYHDVVVAALHSVNLVKQKQRLWKLREHDRRHRHNLQDGADPSSGGIGGVEDGGLGLLGVCTNLEDSQYSPNATSLHGKKGASARLRPSSKPSCAPDTTTIQTADEPLYYRYDGVLLDLAIDLGRRLLPAFDTPTGIPYGTVNLIHGVPVGETPIASLAGGGTLCLEFHLLSKLTGDDRFGKAAKLATRALFGRHSAVSKLYGKHSTYKAVVPVSLARDNVVAYLSVPCPRHSHRLPCLLGAVGFWLKVDVRSGHWTETLSGIGSNSDSFLEYLAKHYFLFVDSDPDFWTMFVSAYSGVFTYGREGEWYPDVDMNTNHQHRHHQRRVLESLMAFYPGMQVLLGEVSPASKSTNAFFLVREWLGFLPERFAYPQWKVDAGRGAGKHPLRPELLESAYFLHRATRGMNLAKASGWLWASDFALHKLEATTRVRCGYAGVANLYPVTSGDPESTTKVYLMDDMPSFFLSETLKYLYLAFDDDNILHRDDDRQWIFTTEAHPIHFVGAEVKSESRFSAERSALKQILRTRLQKTGNQHRRSVQSPSNWSLKDEKWSEKSTFKGFSAKLQSAQVESQADRLMLLKSPEYHSDPFFVQRRLISPLVPGVLCRTEFVNDTRQFDNLAHLAPTNLGVGKGTTLRRACPNLYSSDLLWVHALNGGAFDYSEVFVSVSRDSVEDHPIDFTVLGAAEASGALATGIYPGQSALWDKENTCPLPDIADRRAQRGSRAKANERSTSSTTRSEVVQIRSEEFGLFEVTPDLDGSGFLIHLVDTGEKVFTAFYDDFAVVTSDTATRKSEVHLTDDHSDGATTDSLHEGRQSPWRRMGSRFTAMFGSSDKHHRRSLADGGSRNVPTQRRVTVTDFAGNAFACEVEVFETYPSESQDGDEHDQEEGSEKLVEEVLGIFPCAPARFALTAIDQLAKSGGVTIQAEGRAPLPGDELGCMRSSGEDLDGALRSTALTGDEEEPPTIQFVHRGECSFYSKAVNQRLMQNAEGVIVINDSDDIFIMTAHENDEPLVVESSDVPVTVLVSNGDGEELLEKLSVDKDDEEAMVGLRISITRQPNVILGGEENVEWPFVLGSPDTLIMFVESGWGLQATKRAGRTDWHLQLMRRPRTEEP
jgi:mannosidase alpha-like ER degradation enhancer 2